MEEIQGMLKTLVEDRRQREVEVAAERLRREAEFETERTRMEEERQRREREMGQQMEELQGHLESLMKVVADSRKPEVVSHKRELSVKLVPLTEKEDIEAYLVTFERIMAAHQVEKDCWPQYLAPQLTGRAQLAFAALPVDDSGNYDAIKLAILQRYDITEEAYRRRFRNAVRGSGETNRELAVRLMDLLGKWLKECNSLEEVREYVGMEQFFNTLPAEKRLWVTERKPESCVKAGELMDEYEQARRQGLDLERAVHVDSKPERKCHYCGKVGHEEEVCFKKTRDEGGRQKGIVCFNCRKPGHPARRCPNNRALLGCESRVKGNMGLYCKGSVEGRSVTQILLDTGCSRTMVRRQLVPHTKILEGRWCL